MITSAVRADVFSVHSGTLTERPRYSSRGGGPTVSRAFRPHVRRQHTKRDAILVQIAGAGSGTRDVRVPDAPQAKIKGVWNPSVQPGKASAAAKRSRLPQRLRSRRNGVPSKRRSPSACGNNSRRSQLRQPAISPVRQRLGSEGGPLAPLEVRDNGGPAPPTATQQIVALSVVPTERVARPRWRRSVIDSQAQDSCVTEDEPAISRAAFISPATSRPRSASNSSREPCSMNRSGIPSRRM